MEAILINKHTPIGDLKRILSESTIGTVFKCPDYGTTMYHIEAINKDSGTSYELMYVYPGTELYAMYGHDHCVRVK